MRIGIIGAGKLGTAIARRAVAAGHEVLIAGRPGAVGTDLVIEVMVPGATPAPVTEWDAVDLAILAVPFSTALTLDLPLRPGTIVIDPTNHWEPVDGPRPDLDGLSTSEAIAANHPALVWVKTLNQIGYHDLDESPERPQDMDVATDSADAARTVASFLRTIGLAPTVIGSLADGSLLEPGGERFGYQSESKAS